MSLYPGHAVADLAAAAPEVLEQFRETGLVTFTCRNRREYLQSVSALGSVVPHRDSEPDGVTVVEYREDLAGRPGYTGLSNGPLPPHTDSSGLSSVPQGLALMCERLSSEGGESILIDGQAVAETLQQLRPAAFDEFCRVDSVVFVSGSEEFRGAIFTPVADGRFRVRLRLDRLGYFNYELTPHLPALFEAISLSTFALQLQQGEGYIIDNYRYFHGRRAFTGSRRMLRLLFEPRDVSVAGSCTGPDAC
jgi:alpha-ketoglutarate-dependent taurine dioxygenase